MTPRTSWNEKRAEALAHPEAAAAYQAAGLRFELGAAVRKRRESLGMSQRELADAAGLHQPAVARFEAGGTMPTILMLERYAHALNLRLSVELLPLDQAS
ncbi:helix-turn-helix transcriptional regulator [Streptomyces sp. 891-h]|uniref:helix-turn-helix domain-containing protein n=1 Tax=unclassified Streptomyces TaxID=2593676 RepID=UPI001FAA684B|nr:helix-turn-helix transcriptional regulator [Streptomyces sp. 891-h]UNZ19965.1 helix-turn-helix transcriptional regulator [Streptomyces sp. 891-h]